MKEIGIGIVGLGNVGAGVYKHLQSHETLLAQRLGYRLAVRKVAVRDRAKARGIDLPADSPLLTTTWQEVVDDPQVQVVVELIGGLDEAHELMKRAIAAGKPVVTANKALLAERGPEIFALADAHNAPVFFEAAVAGGIPIIKAMQEGFVGNHINAIYGIINGTCNYILTRMATERGLSYEAALREASDLGYAEADPTLDVSGWDAGHKAIIMASLAYGFWVPPTEVFVEGIQRVTDLDSQYAKELGYTIKLLGIIRADKGGDIEVRVHPALIPLDHVLASVSGVFNAINVIGDVVGETLFYGRGAGQDPTASAVISDICEAAYDVICGARRTNFSPHGLYGKCQPLDSIVCRYFLRLNVTDRPGTLASIARILAEKEIGISSVIQPPVPAEQKEVPLILMIHDSTYGAMREAVRLIASLPVVHGDPSLLIVEDFQ